MKRSQGRALALLAAFFTVTCTPAGPAATGSGERGDALATPAPSRTLVLAEGREPSTLSRALDRSGPYGLQRRLFNAGLAIVDSRGGPRPYLAEALPQHNTDSWRVAPDGTMETAYRLRPNLTWHDGTPLAAEDFIFTWRVYLTPNLGLANLAPHGLMEDVSAPDARTVVIRWKRPYPEANALTETSFPVLPRHILEQPLSEATAEQFTIHPYWTREYVGLGPYRLDRWEIGSFIEAVAFPGYVLSSPQISRIKVIWSVDPNTVLANMLAGTADLTHGKTIRFEQATILRQEWGSQNAGAVVFNPSGMRFTAVQLRPEVAQPRQLLDVRMRRALAHGIDRQALSDGLFRGEGIIADTTIPPSVPYYSTLDRTIAKYPFDPRRVEQLMGEVGLAKGQDGFYQGSSGGRLILDLWQASTLIEEQELAIMADSLRRSGIEARTYAIPPAQLSDGQLKSSFPGLQTTGGGFGEGGLRSLYSGASILRPQEPLARGINFGGWSNAEFDRVLGSFEATLDRTQRNDQVIQMMKLVTEEVPVIALYFNFDITAHIVGLRGPEPESPDAIPAWNIHEWELR